MPKKYAITWTVDDRPAMAAFKRGQAAMEAVEKAALKAGSAAEQAYSRMPAAMQAVQAQMTQAAKSGGSQRKKVAEQEAVQIDVGLHKLQINGIKFQEKLTAGVNSESSKRKRTMDAEARAAESASLGPYGRLSEVRRKSLTEEQLQIAARNKAWDKHHNDRIKQIVKEQGVDKDNCAQSIADAFSFEKALSGVGVALAGIAAGKMAVGAIASAFADAKRASEGMARQVLDTTAALREIAAIKEKFAPDDAELQQHIGVRLASGMTQDQAVEYQEGLANALGTVPESKLSAVERAKLEKQGAAYVARTSRNAATARARADALGMIPNFMKGKSTTASQVTDMADSIDVILGRGAASQQVMTEQYREVLSAMTGDEDMKGFFHDPRQAAGMTAVASSFDKGAPGTATLEAVRALRGFTRFRKTKGLDASQSQTLAAAGINERMNPYEAMQSLFGFADKSMKPDEAFDVFLARRGFRNETANTRLAQFYAAHKKGTLGSIMGMTEAPIVPGQVDVKNEAFLGSHVGRDLVSRAQIDAAKLDRGKQARELVIAKQQAQAQLIGEGSEDTTFGTLKRRIYGVLGVGFKSGADIEQDERALAMLRGRAGQGGGPSHLNSYNAMAPFGIGSGVVTAGAGALLGTDVKRLGEAVFGANAETANRLTDAIEKNNRLIEKQIQGQNAGLAPPALPVGRPQAQAVRP